MRKYILSLTLLAIPLLAFAYDVQVDGIYYNLDSSSKTAEVTCEDSFLFRSYSGSVKIPEQFTYSGVEYCVTSIRGNAFRDCVALTSVTIPNSVTTIGDQAFWGCSGLTSVTIPNSVTSIGSCAFIGCIGLTSVIIGTSVTTIRSSAFEECIGLTSVTVPSSVTTIRGNVFSFCRGLNTLKVESGNTHYDSRNNCNAIIETASNTLIAGCKNTVIPTSVTTIGNYAFSGSSGLTSVTIPTSVTDIIPSAFSGCSGLKSLKVESGNTHYDSRNNCNAIIETASNTLVVGCKNTAIPNSVTIIREEAFSGCRGLTSVTIPNSVTTIGSYAFNGCIGLTEICSMITIPFNTSYCWGGVDKTIPLYVPAGSKDKYQATAGWNEFTNIIEIASGYTLTIQTGAGGTLVYNGTSISGSASNFSVEKGESATISISPNTGYRLSKLIVNGSDVTSAVKNNSYTVSNITANTTISATFEAISLKTYSLSITSSGNGSASYSGATVRGQTTTFTVNEGNSATITFTPDDGYRIAVVKVDGTDVTSKVSGNKYTISGILTNTTVEVVFEAEQSGIDVTQYISATSLGGAITQTNNLINSGSQLNWNFSNKSSYNVTLKSLQLIDGQTGSEGNVMSVNQLVEAGTSVAYTTTIGALGIHTPVTCRFRYDYNGTEYFVDAEYTGTLGRYTLTIESMGNGSVTYDGTRIRNGSDSFRLEMLSSATLTFTPDAGYQLVSLKVGSKDVTSKVSGNKYTISSIVSNTTVIVEFGEALKELSHEGVNYTVESIPEKTVTVAKGSYEQVLTVPASFKEQNITWNVTGIDAGVLQDNKSLAAIIWNPKASFSESVSNPNLLLYVTDAEYAPASIKNVVVNGVAASITLTDAADGNDFYCPREFTAEQISYTHRYEMTSGIEESRGWETISLPFDVGRVEHSTKGAMVPFASWRSGSTEKPFWLYQYGSSGFTEATAIRANTPYIICMPNNEHYLAEYRLNGTVTFSASNVKVKVSDEVTTATNGNRTFAPCFSLRQAQTNDYALNVNNEFTTNSSTSLEGSVFIRNSRAVRPFEAYMTTSVQNAKPFISVFEELPTDIREIEFLDDDVQGSRFNDQSNTWYTLEGQKLSGKPTKRGVYIHNHKVVVR